MALWRWISKASSHWQQSWNTSAHVGDFCWLVLETMGTSALNAGIVKNCKGVRFTPQVETKAEKSFVSDSPSNCELLHCDFKNVLCVGWATVISVGELGSPQPESFSSLLEAQSPLALSSLMFVIESPAQISFKTFNENWFTIDDNRLQPTTQF